MTYALLFASAISGDGEWIKMRKAMSGEEGMLTAGSPEMVKKLPPHLRI